MRRSRSSASTSSGASPCRWSHWLLLDATWNGTSRDDCKGAGACWVFVRMRFGQFMYGQYPLPERWRVDLVGALWVLATVALSWRGLPHRSAATLAAAIVLPPLGIVLLHGGWGTGLRWSRRANGAG